MIAPAQPVGLGQDAVGWTANSLARAGVVVDDEVPGGDNSGSTPGQIPAGMQKPPSSSGSGSGLHVARCPPNTCYVYCICQ